MKSVPVFIYFEFSDAEFREVCLRTCNVVPGGRSPSPICTVVHYLSLILKKETSVNVMTPSHLKMGLTKCYVRYPRSVCVALNKCYNLESTSNTWRVLCAIDVSYTHFGVWSSYPVHWLWPVPRDVHYLIATVRRTTYDNNLPSDVAAGSSIQFDHLVGMYTSWYRLLVT